MSPRLRNLLMTSTALLALGATLGAAARRRAAERRQCRRRLGDHHRRRHHVGHRQPDEPTARSSTGTRSTSPPAARRRSISRTRPRSRSTASPAGSGPSAIDGTLTANGRVFIINRDGMLFGRNAVINTAGFLATTNDIRNADFMAGRMNFNIPGRPDASIVNLGTHHRDAAAASPRWWRRACATPAPSPRTSARWRSPPATASRSTCTATG